MNIMKYVGMYLLTGIVLHWGWSIIFEMWIERKVGREHFSEAIAYYLGLKLRLYDKHSGLREGKLFMEELLEKGPAGLLLAVALTMVIWPTALFEDIAVYSDMCEYVYDVAQGKESSES